MRAIDHIQAGFVMGLDAFPDIHAKWVTIMHRMSGIAGVAHIPQLATAMRLDLLLRQLETEHLSEMAISQRPAVALPLHLHETLAECWLMSSYEVVRATCERLRERGEQEGKLSLLHYHLALVRVPLTKAEIKDAKRKKPDILLSRIGPGPTDEPYQYEADGSYIIGRGTCRSSGAVVWYPIDLKVMGTVAVCRRDLSDEFLNVFS